MNINDVVLVLVPAWFANIGMNLLYVLKKKFPSFNAFDIPLDAQRTTHRGQRILGESTTLLGLPVALIFSLCISVFFSLAHPIAFGLLVGLGVYFGHALGSFVKRRLHYPDGAFLPVIDHIDSVFGAGVGLVLYGVTSWGVVLVACAISALVQPFWNFLWYKLGFRKYPW